MAAETLRFVRIQHDELDPGPFPVAFHDSTLGPISHWKVGWLRLTADDGVVGQAAIGPGDPQVQAALLSEGPRTADEWWQRVFWMLRNHGHRNPGTSGFLYGLDLAMRDILAQRRGVPLHRYLGATRDTVPVYGSGGATSLTITELVAEMRDLAAAGFTTVKMKVGKDFGERMDEDVQRVRAVRAALPDIRLAVDANQIWSAEQALRFARRIAELDIAWFEEPVHSADRQALRELCAACPIPVAMGESENHWLGFRDLAECGVEHLQPAPHCLPGFARWREAVDFTPRGATWSSGGNSHLTALFVATRDDGVVEYLRPIIAHLATCFAEKPRIERGSIHVPTTVGLPLRPDWEGLAARGAVKPLVDARTP